MGEDTKPAQEDKPEPAVERSATAVSTTKSTKKEVTRQDNWQAYSPARDMQAKKNEQADVAPGLSGEAEDRFANKLGSPSRTETKLFMGDKGVIRVEVAPQMGSEFKPRTAEQVKKQRDHRVKVARKANSLLDELDEATRKLSGKPQPKEEKKAEEAPAAEQADEEKPAAEEGDTPADGDKPAEDKPAEEKPAETKP